MGRVSPNTSEFSGSRLTVAITYLSIGFLVYAALSAVVRTPGWRRWLVSGLLMAGALLFVWSATAKVVRGFHFKATDQGVRMRRAQSIRWRPVDHTVEASYWEGYLIVVSKARKFRVPAPMYLEDTCVDLVTLLRTHGTVVTDESEADFVRYAGEPRAWKRKGFWSLRQ